MSFQATVVWKEGTTEEQKVVLADFIKVSLESANSEDAAGTFPAEINAITFIREDVAA